MKKVFIFVIFEHVSMVSYSQISWNAKVGMNMSNFTGDMDTDMKIGFNVGVGMEYQFSDMWSIQPSLMISQKGGKYDEDGETVKFNPMYLEIPVLAAARFAVTDNQNVVVKAGPYFAFGVAGKVKVGDEKGDFFGDGDDQYGGKRFDCGIGVGVAYEIGKFFVGLDGEFGFTNVVDFKSDNVSNPKNMNFSIGVGYKF